jgi:predicted MFS family arabinose efflux permease
VRTVGQATTIALIAATEGGGAGALVSQLADWRVLFWGNVALAVALGLAAALLLLASLV